MKKTLVYLLTSSLLWAWPALADPRHQAPSAPRTIVDTKGNHLALPVTINRVANLWNSANEILVQLGAGDILVGGSVHLRKRPWMVRIFPRARKIAVISQGGVANAEAVLAIAPDLTISVGGRANSLMEMGMPVLQMGGVSHVKGLLEGIQCMGEALGPAYHGRAQTFTRAFNEKLAMVRQRIAAIPESQRVRVLHGSTSSTILDKSLSGDLLKKVGGINAFSKNSGRNISYESILKADPQVIIVACGRHIEYEKFMTDPIYAEVSAVKHKRVYINPSGMFYWDAYSGEIRLQLVWLAKTLYPEHFSDIDLHREVKDFYHRYFKAQLSPREIDHLLAGKDPAGHWQ